MDLYPTKNGLKEGSKLSADEVFDLNNLDLYRWCLNYSPEKTNFHLLDCLFIAAKFEKFVALIHSHYLN